MRPPGRREVAGRRPQPRRQRAEGPDRPDRTLPWVRMVAVAGLVLLAAAIYWLSTAATFAVDPLTVAVSGTRFTSADQVRAAMGLPQGSSANIFRLSSADMVRRAEALPAVLSAQVSVHLPDEVTIAITERAPMLVWREARSAWLLDVDGVAFAPASELDQAELGDGSTGSGLPAVDDQRAPATPPPQPNLAPDASNRASAGPSPTPSPPPDFTAAPAKLGDRLDPTDLAAVRLLGALTPDLIGSNAKQLSLSIDDASGYVLAGAGWRAIFGPYTPETLPPSRIPAQVACLRSLLLTREKSLDQVTLAVGPSVAESCGTFRQATPAPDRPGRAPKP